MFRLYIKLLGASLRSRMQYKVNFLFSAVSYGMVLGIDFLMLAAILYRFDDVKGWNLFEVGLLYGVSSAAISLFRTLAPEIHDFERYMIQGEFDSLLIRPVSPLMLLLSRNIDLSRLGGAVQGLIVIGISLIGLASEGRLTGQLLFCLPFIIIFGTVITFSLSLITATIAFWSGRIKDLQTFTLYAPMNAANYPMSIYPNWLKLIFFTILPVAFMNYVPMIYLLDKGGNWFLLLLSPAIAILSLWISLSFWQYGIRHYHSTGN